MIPICNADGDVIGFLYPPHNRFERVAPSAPLPQSYSHWGIHGTTDEQQLERGYP